MENRMTDPTPLRDIPSPKRRPGLSDTDRQRLAREAIFRAAGGDGPAGIGAYAISMESPWRERIALEPYDPAAYTVAMIRNDYAGAWDTLSDADRRSVTEIVRHRVQQIEAERDRRATARRKPQTRTREWESE
jgi:hypothetical protein